MMVKRSREYTLGGSLWRYIGGEFVFGDIASPAWEQLLLMATSLLGFTVVMYVLVRYAGRA